MKQSLKDLILSTYFEEYKSSYKNIREVGKALLENGSCIVAGNENIFCLGGVGNFIIASEIEGAVGCVNYTMDVDGFLKSEVFKEHLQSIIIIKSNKIVELQKERNELLTGIN